MRMITISVWACLALAAPPVSAQDKKADAAQAPKELDGLPEHFESPEMRPGRPITLKQAQNREFLDQTRAGNERIKELAGKHKLAAAKADKAKIEAELKAALGESFELKVKMQERRLQALEAELGRLKREIRERRARKSRIIQRRFEDLIGEGGSLDW